MQISDFIAQHKPAIIECWCEKVVTRLRLTPDEKPILINDLPELVDDMVDALRKPPDEWPATSARQHARQRIQLGVDIGALSEEIGIVGESVLEVAIAESFTPTISEIALMCRLLARGTAESVTEYARLRDQQMARESARHFSFVAHELRTPLQSAALAVDLIPASAGTVLERLRRAHRELSELIDNSLTDIRLAVDPVLNKEAVMAADLVSAALENARGLSEQRDIELSMSCEDLEIGVDRRLIISVLTNLVINGVKFSAPGGRVEVCARAAEDRVHFEVTDGCGGLPEGAASKMFEPFVQRGADRSGFGLGLVIVKQAVEAHGGSVRVQDRPGEGCTFIVELPRHRSRLSEADAPADPGRTR